MRPEAGTYVVAAVPGPGPGSGSDYDEQPISRTYQYRKVMKPMLERKRRARINRCLDELKELMVGALHAEGENVSKLEKADILELTVRHLHKLRRHQSLVLTPEAAYADRFRAGFSRCAAEVSQYLAGAAGAAASTELMHHLSNCVRHLEQRAAATNTPPASPEPAPETPVTKLQEADADAEAAAVWRPW